MGRTAFSEIVGDDAAGGAGYTGILKNIPGYALASSKYWGMTFNTADTMTRISTDNATPANGTFLQTRIGAGANVGTITSKLPNLIRFDTATSTATQGTAFLYGHTTARIITPFEVFDKDATHPYPSENFFETYFRIGGGGGRTWDEHSWYLGFSAPAPTLPNLSTVGALVDATNLVVFHNDVGVNAVDTLSLKVAGSAGGIVTVGSVTADSTMDGKLVHAGIRVTGSNKISFWWNGVLAAKTVLATALTATRITFGFAIVCEATQVSMFEFQNLTMGGTLDPSSRNRTPQ